MPDTGAAPPGSSRPILPAGVSAPPFKTSRSGYCAWKASGYWVAHSGNCALAEVIAAIDNSAVAIIVLNRVIVVLRLVVLCGELAPADRCCSVRTLPVESSTQ